MKIDNTGKSLPSAPLSEGVARANKTNANSEAKPATPSASTSVSLGSTATQLQKMEANMANSSGIDAKKVAEIKQAISEGRFQVNAGMVADRLIEGVRELIGGRA